MQSSVEGTILGQGFLCLFSFPFVPGDSVRFSSFVSSDYSWLFFLPADVSLFNELLFFHLYLAVLVPPSWWKGIG